MNFNFPSQLKYGLSTKLVGNMQIKSQVRDFLAQQNLAHKILIAPNLVHGRQVITIKDQSSVAVGAGDAVVTNQASVVLTLTVADCLPIYFYDRQNQVIGLAHAGWRGIIQAIAPAVINQLQAKYQSACQNIFVYLGPHLQACHFQVQADVANLFSSTVQVNHSGKIFINLAQVVSQQLELIGVPKENISHSSECTFCLSNKYFSWRRDQPEKLETMLAYISLL